MARTRRVGVVRRLVLALDTSTEAVAVGVARVEDDRLDVLASISRVAPRRANSVLLEWAVEQLGEAGATVRDVGAVVVGRGPGSFTGVRIGVATAKGLAQGLGVPLYGIGTLDGIAAEIALAHSGLLAVAGDAMRGEVYPAMFRLKDGAAERLTVDAVSTPEHAAEGWGRVLGEQLAAEGGGPLLLAGNALNKHLARLEDVLDREPRVLDETLWWPTGQGMLLAWSASMSAGDPHDGDPATVLPVYTRLSDAEENERVRLGLAAIPAPPSGVAGGGGL